MKKWIVVCSVSGEFLEETLNLLEAQYYEIYSIEGDITGNTIIAYRYE